MEYASSSWTGREGPQVSPPVIWQYLGAIWWAVLYGHEFGHDGWGVWTESPEGDRPLYRVNYRTDPWTGMRP